MKITLPQLQRVTCIDKIIIHSLDLSLYQVSVIIADVEYYVTDGAGTFLRSHNKLALQSQLRGLHAVKTVLRQQSAYDEMVGQPQRAQANTLEVDLGGADWAQAYKSAVDKDIH